MDSVALFSWIGWLRHYGIFSKSKFGSLSEKSTYLSISLFNEIEDTVNYASSEELEKFTACTKKIKKKTKRKNWIIPIWKHMSFIMIWMIRHVWIVVRS